jgi:DNA-directed RNA polymerase subunit M/transcription elongation factor TFIIS
MDCAKCGNSMRMTDKNTFTGRDIREYRCDACGYEDWEDRGPALWQILSDDREEFEAAKAAREAAADPDSQADPPQSKQTPAISRWSRFLAWLGSSRKE